MTDDEIRKMWRDAGGSFYGPRVETGAMPEAKLLPFLRSLAYLSASAEPVAWVDQSGPMRDVRWDISKALDLAHGTPLYTRPGAPNV